ncbi:TonB-dependent receptor [Dysgonomonas sp. ZJ279]|uniref:TonB-dependent receptor n=1 Tax=Dysgonomonas sp. ZJ279 TaxID=2709796 RepID=UPI00210660AF|nr:TonB-dependent receptor [Dysgonomonas sp. ZJ279]
MEDKVMMPVEKSENRILLRMKRVCSLLLLLGYMCSLQAHNAVAQTTSISLQLKNVSLETLFTEIEKSTDYIFLYKQNLVSDKRVSVNTTNESVETILTNTLDSQNLAYHINGKQIIITKKNESPVIAPQEVVQSTPVKGVVLGTDGEPLIGASVSIKGTTTGTMTDIEGRFSLNAKKGDVLVCSYIGFNTREVHLASIDKELNIVLTETQNIMDEVVVVGYGTQKKANLTGAVDQITSEIFENRNVPNVTQALEGAIPNLNISLTDGKPGTTASYNIRGKTSIGQEGSALVLIDGVEGEPSMLNPNDIASVTVLKDAASAAIYGARGSFGVVLITTKDPAKDKVSITYSGNASIKRPVIVPDLVTDGYTFANYFNDSWSAWNDYSQTPQNVNKTLKFSDDYLKELQRRSTQSGLPDVEVNSNGDYVYYGSTDWYKELYKNNTFANDHNLTVTGSSGKASYYVTGRYYGQDGIFRYNTDDYSMYNLRAKGSVQVFNWLKVDNNIEYSLMKYHNPLNVGEGGSIWRNIADEGHPLSPMFNPDGTLTHSAAYTVGDFWYGKNGQDTERRIVRNTTSFTATFLENKFRVKGDFTFQNKDDDRKRIRVPVPFSRKPGVIEYVGSSTNDIELINRTTNYLASNIYSEYENTFAKKHYLKGMVGFNYEESTFNRANIQRNGLIYSDADDLNLALGNLTTTSGDYQKWKIAGGFFRANYVFDSRYLLEVNGRLDGSSKFPTDEQYGFFPSVSAGWRISEEPFWQVNDQVLSDLKIRASYGSLGNGNIPPFRFLELLNIAQSGRILNGGRPQAISNPKVLPLGLTWETATTSNFGLDFGSLGGRLRLTADYYIRKTTDMFTPGMTLPDVFGEEVPYGNNANMTTQGYEISVAWNDKFTLANKPFRYEIRASLADARSTIDKYNNPERKLGDGIYYEGQRVGEIWGYVTEGFFTSEADIANHADQSLFKSSTSGKWLPGDIKFKDLDGDGVIDYGKNTVDDPGDKKVIGNTEPRYVYNFMLNAEWNNFSFSTFFQGVGKQDWYPGPEAGLFWGQYNRPYNDMPKSQLGNIWTEDNPDAYFPRYRGYIAQNGSGTLRQPQTKYLQSVAYLRLKNIQIGYNLPQKFISRIKMQNARIYLTGENLWCWSPLYKHTDNMDVSSIDGSDRDLTSGTSGNGWNYPLLKSVTFGLSLTF